MATPNLKTSGLTPVTNLVSVDDYQFAVWYTVANECCVGRIQRGVHRFGVNHTQYQFAGAPRTVLGMPVPFDEHNHPGIAVDGNGRIHIWANMHNQPIRYVRTVDPHTSNTWTAAAGWVDAGGELPGVDPKCSYPTPVQLPDGGLWMYLRSDAGTQVGSGAADSIVWTRTPTGTTWTSLGVFFQGCLVPEAGGVGVPGASGDNSASRTNWNAYQSVPYVESARDPHPGRFHLAWTWRVATLEGGDNNVMFSYGYSDNNGVTWKAIDGTTLTLPITPLNSVAARIPGSAFVKTHTRTSNVVTAELDTSLHGLIVGDQIEMWSDAAGFEGTFTIASVLTSPPRITWAQTAADASSYGGNVMKYPLLFSGLALAADAATGLPHIFASPAPRAYFHRNTANTAWVRETVPASVGGRTRTGNNGAVLSLGGKLMMLTTTTPTDHRRIVLTGAMTAAQDAILSGGLGGTDPDIGSFQANYDREAWRRFGTVEVLAPSEDSPRVYTFGHNARHRAA